MISIFLDGNLKDCIQLIRDNHIHRIVVEDQKSSTITGFITYEAIFEFFIENYYSSMTHSDLEKVRETYMSLTETVLLHNIS